MMFEIDFKRLVALLLPMSLRRPLIFDKKLKVPNFFLIF